MIWLAGGSPSEYGNVEKLSVDNYYSLIITKVEMIKKADKQNDKVNGR